MKILFASNILVCVLKLIKLCVYGRRCTCAGFVHVLTENYRLYEHIIYVPTEIDPLFR